MSAKTFTHVGSAPAFAFDDQRQSGLAQQLIRDPFVIRYNGNGTLTYVNPDYCNYLRLRPEQLLGSNFIHRVPLDELPRVSRELTRLSAIAPRLLLQHCVITPNGERRRHLWLHRLLHGGEAQPEYLASGLDISEIGEKSEPLTLVARHLERMQSSLIRGAPPPPWRQGEASP